MIDAVLAQSLIPYHRLRLVLEMIDWCDPMQELLHPGTVSSHATQAERLQM